MKILRRLGYEFLFIYRYGFLLAYLFVLAVYAAILLSVKNLQDRSVLAVVLIYSDISMLGFIFSAAGLHLEVDSGTVAVLGVSPQTSSSILWPKALVLSAVSLGFGFLLALIGVGRSIEIGPFLLGSLICGATFTCLGISLTTRTTSLTRLLLVAGLLTLPMALPLLGFLGLWRNRLLLLLPGAGGLEWMAAGLSETYRLEPWDGLIALLTATGWLAAAFIWASRDMRLRLFQKAGER